MLTIDNLSVSYGTHTVLSQLDLSLERGGIYRMLELVGAPPDCEVIVFGDDTNDINMFAPEFYKVAMGNGHPLLKALADEVAPANTDDGIYRVCEKNGWFE